ncbi:hypothetical protein Tco_0451017 [Tanacetum coccineum]
MACYNQSQLKNKSFAEIQKLFDKAMTRVNMFVDMDIELVKESSKKAKAKMAQESSSNREKEDDEIVDATPLSVKIPIVDYKIYRKGKLVNAACAQLVLLVQKLLLLVKKVNAVGAKLQLLIELQLLTGLQLLKDEY